MSSAAVIAKKINLPPILLLIPFPLVKGLIEHKRPQRQFSLINSKVRIFDRFALITEFIGYPHLLTLLETIADVKKKEIYFLGTAGAVSDNIAGPSGFTVNRIFASSLFRLFSRQESFPLLPCPKSPFPLADVASVDLMRRETRHWVKQQKIRGIDLVEMELFPLRVYLEKPFMAFLIASDRVEGCGYHPWRDKKKSRRLFIQAFHFILSKIDESQSHHQS